MRTFTPEETAKGKKALADKHRKLKDGSRMWGVWQYKWDMNCYAFPFDGLWHPKAKDSDIIADNLTENEAEKLASVKNKENYPKYEAILQTERDRYNEEQALMEAIKKYDKKYPGGKKTLFEG